VSARPQLVLVLSSRLKWQAGRAQVGVESGATLGRGNSVSRLLIMRRVESFRFHFEKYLFWRAHPAEWPVCLCLINVSRR
jgi:hypothetical protein